MAKSAKDYLFIFLGIGSFIIVYFFFERIGLAPVGLVLGLIVCIFAYFGDLWVGLIRSRMKTSIANSISFASLSPVSTSEFFPFQPYCGQCGSPLNPNVKICESCGHSHL